MLFIGVTNNVRIKWEGHVARNGERSVTYRVLVGKLEGKRPHGIPSCRWEDDIKMHNKEIG